MHLHVALPRARAQAFDGFHARWRGGDGGGGTDQALLDTADFALDAERRTFRLGNETDMDPLLAAVRRARGG